MRESQIEKEERLSDLNRVDEIKARELERKTNLKAKSRALIKKYSKVKQMTIDYYCREDLAVTTLKEFFEIFISFLKKQTTQITILEKNTNLGNRTGRYFP